MRRRTVLTWRGPILYRGSRPIASVVPDPDVAMLWRVRRRDGSLSDDAVNLTRAREEALVAAELEERRS